MNWVGGARSRVKISGERKVQKDFFDRKRLGPKLAAERLSLQKKPRLSQDLLALHLVNKTHSQKPDGAYFSRPIKSVDFGKFRSCTQQINEVDMGPCSPVHTPSMISLNEGKSTNRDLKEPTLSQVTHTSHKTAVVKDPPKPFRTRPELESERDSGFSLSEGPSYIDNKQDSFITRDCGLQKSQTSLPPTKLLSLYNSKHEQDEPGFLTVQDSCNKLIYPDKRDSFLYTKYDPFVSEDFQVTPTVNYGPPKRRHEHRHKDKHKVKTASDFKTKDGKETSGKGYQEIPYQFSSTPLCHTMNEQYENRDRFSSSSEVQLSPINKHPSNDKSEFKYKPRPMTSTKECKPWLEKRETHSQDHQTATTDYTIQNPLNMDVCQNGRYPGSESFELYQQRELSKKRHPSCSSGQSSIFEVSPLSGSNHSFEHGVKRRQLLLGNLPRYDGKDLTVGTGEMQFSSPSSLSKYRKHYNQHANHGNFTDDENLNTSFSTVNIEKPVFDDLDDFEYKPNNTFRKCRRSENVSPVANMEKPVFEDEDDEFVYRPNTSFGKRRTCIDNNRRHTPEVVMYTHTSYLNISGNDKSLKHTPLSATHIDKPVLDDTDGCDYQPSKAHRRGRTAENVSPPGINRSPSDNERSADPCPEAGEDITEHLQTSLTANKQDSQKDDLGEEKLGEDKLEYCEMTSYEDSCESEAKTDSHQIRVPGSHPMEDVLNEMSLLEQQDILVPDNTTSQISLTDISTTEGDEADKFLESELLMLEFGEELITHAKAKTSDSTAKVSCKMETQTTTQASSVAEEETQMTKRCDNDSCLVEEETSSKLTEKAIETQCNKVDSQSDDLEENETMLCKIPESLGSSACKGTLEKCEQNHNIIVDPITQKVIDGNSSIIRTEKICDTIEALNDNIRPLNDNIKPFSDNVKPFNDNIKPFNDNIKPFNDNIKPFNEKKYSDELVQVADVSSGKNQYTQTIFDSRQCAVTVDVATSPYLSESVSVGVQYEVIDTSTTVPSLVYLACRVLMKTS